MICSLITISHFVCIHIYVHMFMCVGTYTHRCLPQSLSTLFFSDRAPLSLELRDSAKLSGQQAPGILLPRPPQCWDYRHTTAPSFSCRCWGSKFRSSCLHGKHFTVTYWANSVVLFLMFLILILNKMNVNRDIGKYHGEEQQLKRKYKGIDMWFHEDSMIKPITLNNFKLACNQMSPHDPNVIV